VYLRVLDEPRELATRPVRPSPAPAAGDDPEVSWQRLLSFADRVRTARGGT
jgi:hypothetical protein